MTVPSPERNPIEKLAEEFAERRRRGENPSVSEYAARHPELADEICELFPALLVMEELTPARGELTGPWLSTRPGAAPIPAQLGEYRILREIGHGGMGVVYEAEQVSLGRRVALKVLPFQALLQPHHLERFRREAKAAAQLHHTNIVPVFGVGEQNGIYFFAMQYIQGQGLDAVLEDVKKLRGIRSAGAQAAHAPTLSMAAGLLSGAFAKPEGPPAAEGPAAAPPVADPPPAAPASSGRISLSTESRTPYYRSVAEIGVQVADALAHAHKQGILHRDIKPANLLLDAQGTVWVTDFGLAKAEDSDELTHSGDIVGTLRYMAPERFRGWSDPRSDVYGLGVTLYELLTLQPAFTDSTRSPLVQRIETDNPPPPRRLDPHIPRDLETIVLKAMEKEPAQRYQTAAELGEDLRRFLADKPIRARRAGAWDLLRKWVKRRPAVAALGAALGVALLCLAGVWVWSYFQIRESLARAESQRQEAVAAREREAGERQRAEEARQEAMALHDTEAQLRKQAEAARAEALTLRDAAQAEAYRATLGETRALRLAHPQGWRRQVLQNLKSLNQVATAKRDPAQARAEAVAAVLGLDAWEVLRLKGHEQVVRAMDFSPDGRTLATADYQGSIRLWDVVNGTPLREIPNGAQGPPDRLVPRKGYPAVRFDPQNRYLAYAASERHVGFDRLEAGALALPQVSHFSEPRSLALDREGRWLAVGWSDGHVIIYNAATGEVSQRFFTGAPAVRVGSELLAALSWAGQPGWPSVGSLAAFAPGARRQLYFPPVSYYMPIALSPDASMLAACAPNYAIQLFFLNEEKPPLRLIGHRGGIRSLAFSPDGKWLVSCSYDQSARLWDTTRGRERLDFRGHTGPIRAVAVSPDGSLIATASHDESARLWDVRTGESLLTLRPGLGTLTGVAFSPDGTRLAVASRDVVLYELAGIRERRRLPAHRSDVRAVAFHPLRRQLVTGGSDRQVYFWDLPTGGLTRGWRGPYEVGALALSPDGEMLAVGGHIPGNTSRPAVELRNLITGECRWLVGHASYVAGLVFDPAGKRLAASGYSGSIALWDVASGDLLRQWNSAGGGFLQLAFLDQGRQLLAGTKDRRVVILDVEGGQVIRQVSMPAALRQVVASPRGDCAAALTQDGTLRLLSLPGLEEIAAVPKAHPEGYFLAFSSDGLLLASGGRDRKVHLWDARTLRPLYSLPEQNSALYGLAFDPEGHFLALVGAESLVTLVNLRLLHDQLAAVGLEPEGPASGQRVVTDLEAPKPPPSHVVQAPPSDVKNATALRQRVTSLYRQSKWAEVVPVAQKAIEANPEPKELYQYLGQAYYEQREYAKALAAYQGHLDRCKDCAMALERIGTCQMHLRHYDQARLFLERVLTTRRNHIHGSALNQLARLHALGPMEHRDVPRALGYAERAVNLIPDRMEFRSTLGRVYYRAGQYGRAAETLLKSDSPSNPSQTAVNLLFLAMSYQMEKRVDEARKAYERALKTWGQVKQPAEQLPSWDEAKAEADRLLGLSAQASPAANPSNPGR